MSFLAVGDEIVVFGSDSNVLARQTQLLQLIGIDKSRVAEVVSHHDGGVERGEIKSGDWLFVKTNDRLQHKSTLVALFV